MKKGINFGIKGLLISMLLFVLGMFITSNASFLTFMRENSMAVQIVSLIFICLCVGGGFMIIITFITVIITCICLEYHNKKIDKYNCKLRQNIKNELSKEKEFNVSIANPNNEDLNKLLCEHLKCTALFDGNTVHIKMSLPKEVILETDDVLWFNDNFKY